MFDAFLDELYKIAEAKSQIGRLVRKDALPSDDEESSKNEDRSDYANRITHSSTDPEQRSPVEWPKGHLTNLGVPS